MVRSLLCDARLFDCSKPTTSGHNLASMSGTGFGIEVMGEY
jgi:hypothetical protein